MGVREVHERREVGLGVQEQLRDRGELAVKHVRDAVDLGADLGLTGLGEDRGLSAFLCKDLTG